jgi:peptide/nickel transport system substrate-binding protein
MGGWNMRPTADMMFSTAFASDAPYNDSHWRRPEFDKLLIEARATIDRARRKEIYCTMQRMIHEDGGVIIPVFPNLLDGGSKRVKGLEPHPLGSLGRWEWEKVYLES